MALPFATTGMGLRTRPVVAPSGTTPQVIADPAFGAPATTTATPPPATTATPAPATPAPATTTAAPATTTAPPPATAATPPVAQPGIVNNGINPNAGTGLAGMRLPSFIRQRLIAGGQGPNLTDNMTIGDLRNLPRLDIQQRAANGSVNAQAQLAAQNPAAVQSAYQYYQSLDPSGKAAFLSQNSAMSDAFIQKGLITTDDINFYLAGNAVPGTPGGAPVIDWTNPGNVGVYTDGWQGAVAPTPKTHAGLGTGQAQQQPGYSTADPNAPAPNQGGAPTQQQFYESQGYVYDPTTGNYVVPPGGLPGAGAGSPPPGTTAPPPPPGTDTRTTRTPATTPGGAGAPGTTTTPPPGTNNAPPPDGTGGIVNNGTSTYTPPNAPLPGDTSNTNVNPALQNVTADQTVQGQLSNILKTGNPIIDQARAAAMEAANARGLQNSTLAAQAGEEAAVQSALPIATSDAATYQKQALANQDIQNQFLASKLSTNEDIQKAYQAFLQSNYTAAQDDKLKAYINDSSNTSAQKIAALQSATQMNITNANNAERLTEAGMNIASQQLMQQAGFTNADMLAMTTIQDTELRQYTDQVNAINNNTNMSADDKKTAILELDSTYNSTPNFPIQFDTDGVPSPRTGT